MAPTGANRQGWRFVVVRDQDLLDGLGALYRARFAALRAQAEGAFADKRNMFSSMEHLAEHLAEVPVVLLVGATGHPPPEAPFTSRTNWYASVFPAVQNLMLSARAHGLGTTLTTLVLEDQEPIRRLVHAPDDVTFAACIPLGYPVGQFGRPKRSPVDQVAFLDTFDRAFVRPETDPAQAQT